MKFIIFNFLVASTTAFVLECDKINSSAADTCFSFRAETSPQYPDKARVDKVNLEKGDAIKVKMLALLDIQTRYLPTNMFTHLPNVEKLYVSQTYTKMSAPKNGHFLKASNLKEIIIVNQRFKALDLKVFEGAKSVGYIKLENDEIDSIHEESFFGLKNLTELNLAHNEIKSIPLLMFQQLPKLTTLDLSSNMISTLPSGLFGTNRFLEGAKFAHNRLMSISPQQLLDSFKFDFTDNICVDQTFEKTSEMNKFVKTNCNIEMEPEALVEAFRNQMEINANCDGKETVTNLKEKLDELRKKKTELLLKKENMEHEITKEKIFRNSMC